MPGVALGVRLRGEGWLSELKLGRWDKGKGGRRDGGCLKWMGGGGGR